MINSLLFILLLTGCAIPSQLPPLPPKASCEWNVTTDYFKGDKACEDFLRAYVAARLSQQ